MAVLSPLPPALIKLLTNDLPTAGTTHLWLARAAFHMVRVMPANTAINHLRRVVDSVVSHRPIRPREIEDAVDFASRVIRGEVRSRTPGIAQAFPPPQPDLIDRCLATSDPLCSGEPLAVTAPKALAQVFDPDDLICYGPDKFTGLVGKLADVAPVAGAMQFIIPNPLRGLAAPTRTPNKHTGETVHSPRAQSNILARRFLIVEFDNPEIAKVDQTRLARVLAGLTKLKMIVDSGGKSIHAWFDVRSLSESDVHLFFSHAHALGADRAMFSPSAWCRMPGGTRRTDLGLRSQPVVYMTEKV
jgi:hypothetical protein